MFKVGSVVFSMDNIIIRRNIFRSHEIFGLSLVLLLMILPIYFPDKENNNTNFESNKNEIPNDALISNEDLDFSIPSYFIENKGQLLNEEIKYYITTNSISIGFAKSKVEYIINEKMDNDTWLKIPFSMTFKNANEVLPISNSTNQFRIAYHDSSKNITDVLTFSEIFYYDIYPSIDLKYYFSEKGLKYEFIVHPEADPKNIEIVIEPNIYLEITANKVAYMREENLTKYFLEDSDLFVYQEGNNIIDASFCAKNCVNSYGFDLGIYDESKDLIIDPLVLDLSRFIGGTSRDDFYKVTTDSKRNIIAVGCTSSSDFPAFGSYDTIYNGGTYGDVIVVKFSPNGTILWSTYLGGNDYVDYANGVVIDKSDNIIVICRAGLGFPAFGGYDSTLNDGGGGYGGDIAVCKFNSTGTLLWSTFVGGGALDWPGDVTLDVDGNIYVAGSIHHGTAFPTINSWDPSYNGGEADGILFKLSADGQNLLWTTYLGGNTYDMSRHIVMNSKGELIILTWTSSTNFPVLNAYQTSFGGTYDIAISKFTTSGVLILSTYFGGNGHDDVSNFREGKLLSLDHEDNIIIGFTTGSTNLPVVNGNDSTFNGGTYDAYYVKFNNNMTEILSSSYFGGTGDEHCTGIAVDKRGGIWMSGDTASTDFPVLNGYDHSYNGGTDDGFITYFTPNGVPLISSYIGSSGTDTPTGGIAVDSSDQVYIVGRTDTASFPTTTGPTLAGSYDAYICRFRYNESVTLNLSRYLGGSANDYGAEIVTDSQENIIVVGSTLSSNFPVFGSYDISYGGGTDGDAFVTKMDNQGNLLWSTYLGASGSCQDCAYDVAIADNDDIIVNGRADTGFPAFGGYDSSYNDGGGSFAGDVFIARFNSTGTLLWSTFIGGNGHDIGLGGIALDVNGDIFCSGYTGYASSNSFPIVNAYDSSFAGSYNGEYFEGFAFKLSGNGQNLLWSTWIGGYGDENPYSTVVDHDGNVIITGYVNYAAFPTYNAYDSSFNGNFDIFIVKISNSGTLLNATYFGGSAMDFIGDGVSNKIAVDSQNNIIFYGRTASTDIPLVNAYDNSLNGVDCILVKFDENLANIQWSTLIGGSGEEHSLNLDVDENDNIWVVGETHSTDLPTLSAFDNTFNGGDLDSFIAKFSSSGSLLLSSYIGGSGNDHTYGLCYVKNNYLLLTGLTSSINFPETMGTSNNGGNDVFVLKLKLGIRINHPNDLNYIVGTTNNIINWTITDSQVGTTNYTIFQNSTQIASNTWTSGVPLSINIDGLSIGSYEYKIIVYDGLGEWTQDILIVNVIQNLPKAVEYEYIGGWIGASNQIFDVEYINGYIYVIGGYSGWSIIKYYPNGTYITHWVVGDWCRKLEWDFGDYFYYTSTSYARKYNINDVAQFDFGSFSADLGGIAISPANVFISASQENNIKKYDTMGNFITNFGSSGSGNGQFNNPQEIAYGNGELFVADTGNHRVQVFSTDGTYLRQWASPNAFCISYHDGYVIVAEYSETPSIHIYDINGNLINSIGLGFSYPRDIDISPDHILYVVDTLGLRVEIYQLNFNEQTVSVPSISTPNDQTNFEGITGKNITWTITDNITMLANYTVYCNGTLNATGTWRSGIPITIGIDGRGNGYWNWTIIVSDGMGSNATDTVWVQVIANNPPTIESSGVTTYVFGTTNNLIQWTITDTTIATTEYTIYRNGTSMTTGSWVSGTPIQYNVDGLAPGIYNFTILAQDGIGNSSQNTMIVTVTNVNPGLTQPADFSYLETTTGHFITWTATDTTTNASRAYTVLRNGTLVASGPWESGTGISISAAGLSVGHWNFTIVVTDGIGGSETDTVWVQVIANNPPTIESSGVTTYVYGTTSNLIQWTITDTTIATTGYTIYRNGTSMTTGSWVSGTPIQYNVDGLAVGSYNFTILAADGVGNFTQNIVILTVTNDLPTITHPADQTWIENTPGQVITWQVTDGATATRTYTVWRNTTNSFATGSWISGTDITINLVGLAVGYHNFTIIAEDGLGDKVIDEVWVHVLANTIPTLIGPADCMYFYGVGGNTLDWTPTDPDIYTAAYSVLRNGTGITSGGWTTGVNISLNIDGRCHSDLFSLSQRNFGWHL
jgi:hypothetical protein